MTTSTASKAQRMMSYLEADPTNPHLMADAARAAFDEGDNDAVLALMERHQAIAPIPDDLQNLGGMAKLSLGRFDSAAATFAELLTKAPEDPALRFNLAWCKAMLGAWDEVENLIDDSVLEVAAQAAMLKAQALHHQGRLDEALSWGAKMAARRPDDRRLQGTLAVIALDAEDFALASKFAAMAPETPEGLSTRGSLLLTEGRLGEALGAFDRALQTAPADGRALLGKGLTQMAAGDYRAAAVDIDRAATEFGDHLGSWVAAGWAHLALGDHLTSRHRFDRALDLDDAFAEVHGGLAVLDILEGQLESGRRRTEVARRLDRECFAAALATSLLLTQAGDQSGAQRVRERALNAPAGPGGTTIAQAMVTIGRQRSR